MSTSLINALFYEEPAGTFSHGHIFKSAPDLGSARQDPGNGYWHCNIADHDALTWSAEVYELFRPACWSAGHPRLGPGAL